MSELIASVASAIWSPVIFLIILGGVFFIFYSGFVQYKYLGHTIAILRGKYNNPDDPGQINAYQALSTALASTVGMGNIAGVAAAISIGGPGALFWMWVTAIVGMATNFFTSTLSVMYRGKDSAGEIQGGPMYVIREGLSRRWYPLAVLFSVCCLVGCLPIFQANQLTQILVDTGVPAAYKSTTFFLLDYEISTPKLIIGAGLMILSGFVVIGGIQRIGSWAGNMVPLMIVLYFLSVMMILFLNMEKVPGYFVLIITDAFSATHFRGEPALGGILGGLIVTGVRRASFSNEAGIGTAPMALGASKSTEPVREGLVSMLSPAIDTLLVCTLTALAILVTDVWRTTEADGVTLTNLAFRSSLGGTGTILLLISAFFFAVTSLFSYSYYGNKAMSFLLGSKSGKIYDYIYLGSIVFAAVLPMRDIINIIDISFALMAIPTMLSGFVLAPKVMKEARSYFKRMALRGSDTGA
ncbi:MAG: amino acid carrier protein [Chryseosolibacter sp.]